MARTGSFAEILEEKLDFQETSPSEEVAHATQFTPIYQWQEPISAPQFSWAPKKIPSQYPKTQPKTRPAKRAKTRTPKPKSQEPIFKIGDLGLEYTGAFMTLVRAGACLEENRLNLSSLKSQYRKLALKYHPDHCKNSNSIQVFRECTTAYKDLRLAMEKRDKKN